MEPSATGALNRPATRCTDASGTAANSVASDTDRAIVAGLAGILTGDRAGKTSTEAEVLAGEIDVALDLLPRPANQARVRHLLATNRPLAN